MRRPGIEPGPPAWKAGILTTELSTPSATGFEPARAEPTRFQVWRLNHSATLTCVICFSRHRYSDGIFPELRFINQKPS